MKRLFFIAATLTLFFVVLSVTFPSLFNSLDAKWVDGYFKIQGQKQPGSNIVLATIDEKSLTKLGRWPWPRSTIAKLINAFEKLEVKAAGFDVTFSETSPEDAVFADSLKRFPNVFLGYFFYLSPDEVEEAALSEQEIRQNEGSIFPSRLALSSKQMEASGRRVYGVQSNVPEIAKALPGNAQGFFNVFPERDGVIRFMPLALFYKTQAYPSLALQMASFSAGFSPIPIFKEEGVLEGLAMGRAKIPLNEKGELFINYRGDAKTFPHISIADILENKISKDQLKDKLVLVGATAVGIYDMRVTPTSPNFPGLEIQANVLDNLLTGDFLVHNRTTEMISFFLILAVGLLLALLLPNLRALNSLFAFLTLILLLLGGGYLFFIKYGFVIHTMTPALNGLFVYGGVTVYRYFTEERERRKIKKTFQHYLSPSVIKVLLEHPEKLMLGGERKVLTVLFSDIRDFTPKSEKLPPEKVVQLLNDYFTVMTDIVFKYEGTLDKFMGDAIMAIFGAPLPQEDHAERASLAALEMLEALEKHKKTWCEKYGLDDFKIGIGIHTGEMAVGNMGSLKRFNYTVIGDNVNLASRLETLTKEHNVSAIISEGHYQIVKNKIIAKELGAVKVKGKEEETTIYELVGTPSP